MSLTELTAFEKEVIATLSERAGLAATLLGAWSNLPAGSVQTAKSITAIAQLGVTEERGAKDVLRRAADIGLLEPEGQGYAAGKHNANVLKRISFGLRAIEFYLGNVHVDASKAQIVLTKPPRPSTLENELAQLGWRTADVEPTDHAFLGMVHAAKQRVVVMTPFFDVKGAIWLKELFGRVSPGVSRVLILRSLEDHKRPDYPLGFDAIGPWLAEQLVEIFNYSILRPDGFGRETFHAKVVLCDNDHVYIGSSNLNSASLEHSMEMGVVLNGKAALDAAVVMEAVLKTAKRFA